MKKVFLSEYIHPKAYNYLSEHAEIVSDWDKISIVDAVIDRNFKIDSKFMDQAKNLKVIGIHGTGTDDVDLVEAEERNIQVFSVPHQNAQSVAEMNVTLMLALGRKLINAYKKVSENKSENLFQELQGNEFSGKTVGFIGVGDIAKRTADICRYGFKMNVIGWSRHLNNEEAERLGIKKIDTMDLVFKEADVIMIGLSLNQDTYEIIGEKQFNQMKKNAILINTTRGAILKEKDLYYALRERKILGAACDVVVNDPIKSDHPLFELDNFIGTPHLGANTDEALERVGMAVVEGVLHRLSKC